MNIPLLIVSDSITAPTGLARIARELAVRIHANLSETFEVATCGQGGTYSRQFGFTQYPVMVAPNWTIPQLPYVWRDFAGDRKGVILFIWNQSWLPWMANPDSLPDGDLKSFLNSGQFETWLYCPIDAEGPMGKLPASQAEILTKFNRVLAYTKFGADVIDRTCGWEQGCTEYLPHGTDDATFHPRSRKEARACFLEKVVQKGQGLISDDVLLLGICATNTPRKNWHLGFEVCAELLRKGKNVGLLAHTDAFQKSQSWDLLTLADSFGMKQRTIFTNSHLDDDQMTCWYAACYCTLGIGDGEGFGYPLSESLAMGIPVIHGNYAGGADFVPKKFLVDPVAYRGEGYYCNRRPVFNPKDWADRVQQACVPGYGTTGKSLLNPKYLWKNCWPAWAEWLERGVHGERNHSASSAL